MLDLYPKVKQALPDISPELLNISEESFEYNRISVGDGDNRMLLWRDYFPEPPCSAVNVYVERLLNQLNNLPPGVNALEYMCHKFAAQEEFRSLWCEYGVLVLTPEGDHICNIVYVGKHFDSFGIALYEEEDRLHVYVTSHPIVGAFQHEDSTYYLQRLSYTQDPNFATAATIGRRLGIGSRRNREHEFNMQIRRIMHELFEEASQTESVLYIAPKTQSTISAEI